MVRHITVEELERCFEVLVAKAEAGETFVIIRGGKAIVDLGPHTLPQSVTLSIPKKKN